MLKVMTLNLNYDVGKHGAWADRKQLIKEVITEADPDIIALQAVAKDPSIEGGKKDQAGQLAELLPQYKHHYFYAINTNGNREEGNAFLSKLALEDVEVKKLTLGEGDDKAPRLVLRAKLDLPNDHFYLFNAHFSWVETQTTLNVAETLPFINAVTDKALLVGDLNTPPESSVFDPFKTNGWSDTWALHHPKEDGFTFESNKPFTRIDYGWANLALKNNVQKVEILKKSKGENVRLSDHLGLLITIV